MNRDYETGKNAVRIGLYASFGLAALTIITFGLAMMAIPPAGPNCPGDCMDYPYLDSLKYFPRDYFWMYLSVFQIIAYVICMISIHYITSPDKRIFSTISVAFALLSALILLADYYVQFTVVPISFMKGETEGIPLISQYNGHGIFIALEELGYWLMGLSFLFIAPVFSKHKRLERSIRWILILPFPLIVISFIVYTILYGIDRDYRFEVAAITVDWLALILMGILMGIFFSRLNKR